MDEAMEEDYSFQNISSGIYSNHTELSDDDIFYIRLWTIVTPTLFAAINVIGTVGNTLVIYVILSRASMRTPTNLLLLNLAIADIAFLQVYVSFTAYKYYADSWPFGDGLCKLVQYLLYVTAYVTVYTLVAISAVRFLTVVYPLNTKRFRTGRNILVLNGSIWLTMLAVNVPTLWSHKTKSVYGYSYCGNSSHAVKPIYWTFFVFAYLLPLAVICLLYRLIVVHLRRHARESMLSAGSRARTSRASRVVIIVVVVFGVCWLPSHVNSLLATVGWLPDGRLYQVCRVLWYSLAYGNSCANPIIYSYASQDFRQSFREVVCCSWCPARVVKGQSVVTTTETIQMMPKQSLNTTNGR